MTCIGSYVILHLLLISLFPDSPRFEKLLFLIFSVAFGGGIIFFSKERVTDYLTLSINPKYIPISRVLYASFSIYTAIQHITLIASGTEPMNENYFGLNSLFLAYAISIIYVIGLTLILFGKYIRISWIIVFIAGVYAIPFSLEIFIKNSIAFFAIFIHPNLWLGKPHQQNYNGTGIILMGLALSFLMTCAGLFKLVDPVWKEGLGLYYSLNISFFMPEHLWPLLEQRNLLWVLNHITTLVEIISFPLFVFRKTRFYGSITLVSLGLFLSYPMGGIGLTGGATILTLVPLLLAIRNPNRVNFRTHQADPIIAPRSFNSDLIYLALFWWSVAGFYFHASKRLPQIFNFYPQYGAFIANDNQAVRRLPEMLRWRLQTLTFALGRARPPAHFESIWCIELFNYHHLFDRAIFKVIFKDSEGNNIEPRHFFKDNGALHPDYPLPLNERFILSAWRIMLLRQTSSEEKFDAWALNDFKREFMGIINYCMAKVDKLIKVEQAQVLVKPLHQPYTFAGNKKPWVDMPFKTLYVYSFKTREEKVFLENIPPFEFRKLQIPAFSKGAIRPQHEN